MRRTFLGVLLIAAMLHGDEFPEASALKPAKQARAYRRNYPLPGGAAAAPTPEVRTAKLLGSTLVFVDVDGNGAFGDVNVDGWTVLGKEYGYIVPVEESIAVGTYRVWLHFPPGGQELRYRFEQMTPFPPSERGRRRLVKPILQALEAWNRIRLRNGLVPGRLDPELCRSCQLHAVYVSKYGVTHKQDPSRPEYTKEGAEAGRAAGVSGNPPREEVGIAYRTFFHRIQLIHPTGRRLGIGAKGSASVLDGSRAREHYRRWTWPVCIPAADTTGHPRQCAPEMPVSHPEVFHSFEGIGGAGCPVTLLFPTDDVTNVKAGFRRGGPKGKPVSFLLSWPERPAAKRTPDNYKCIALIPRKPLRGKTRYWVHVEYEYRGRPDTRTWVFVTSK